MIKVVAKRKDGTPLVFFGLSGENVTRMVGGEPMLVDMTELGLPAMHVAIMYGRTERDITNQLTAVGLLPPEMAERAHREAGGGSERE